MDRDYFVRHLQHPDLKDSISRLDKIVGDASALGLDIKTNISLATTYTEIVNLLDEVRFSLGQKRTEQKKMIADLLGELEQKLIEFSRKKDGQVPERDTVDTHVGKSESDLEIMELSSGDILSSVSRDGDLAKAERTEVRKGDFVVSVSTDYGGPESKYDHNEDSYFVCSNDKGDLFVGVIDGAGGGELGGTFPSIIANKELSDRLSKGGELSAALDRTSLTIIEETKRRIAERGLTIRGSGAYACAVVARIDSRGFLDLGWRGDSRATVLRKGRHIVEATTEMQNFAVKDLKKTGRPSFEYYSHPHNNVITGGLGVEPRAGYQPPDGTRIISGFKLSPGDQVVIASDGVWDLISLQEIERLSISYHGNELEKKITELALQRSGKGNFQITIELGKTIDCQSFSGEGDNITVAVIEYV